MADDGRVGEAAEVDQPRRGFQHMAILCMPLQQFHAQLGNLSSTDQLVVVAGHVVRAATGRRVDQRLAGKGARVVEGALQPLDRDRQLWHAEMPRRSVCTLSQQIAQALSPRDHLHQSQHWLRVAPGQLQPVDVVAANDPLVVKIVEQADGVAAGNGVHAVQIAQVAGQRGRFQVAAADRAR